MVHGSQDGSTGWTRNSCRGAIAKVEDAPFELSPRRGGRAPAGRREDAAPVLEIYHPRPRKARDGRPDRGPVVRPVAAASEVAVNWPASPAFATLRGRWVRLTGPRSAATLGGGTSSGCIARPRRVADLDPERGCLPGP